MKEFTQHRIINHQNVDINTLERHERYKLELRKKYINETIMSNRLSQFKSGNKNIEICIENLSLKQEIIDKTFSTTTDLLDFIHNDLLSSEDINYIQYGIYKLKNINTTEYAIMNPILIKLISLIDKYDSNNLIINETLNCLIKYLLNNFDNTLSNLFMSNEISSKWIGILYDCKVLEIIKKLLIIISIIISYSDESKYNFLKLNVYKYILTKALNEDHIYSKTIIVKEILLLISCIHNSYDENELNSSNIGIEIKIALGSFNEFEYDSISTLSSLSKVEKGIELIYKNKVHVIILNDIKYIQTMCFPTLLIINNLYDKTEYRDELIKLNLISYLLNFKDDNPHLDLILHVISKIIIDENKYAYLVVKSGWLPVLIRLIKENNNKEALKCILNLFFVDEVDNYIFDIIKSGMIEELIELLNSNDTYILLHVLSCFNYLLEIGERISYYLNLQINSFVSLIIKKGGYDIIEYHVNNENSQVALISNIISTFLNKYI